MPKIAVALLLSALVLSACDDNDQEVETDEQAQALETDDEEAPKEEAEPQVVAFPQNDWECTEESAEKIEEWLEVRGEMNAQRIAIDKPENMELAERNGEALSGDYRPTIALEYNRLSIDGRPVSGSFYGDLESLSRPIRTEVTRVQEQAAAEAELTGEEHSPPLPLVLIDQSVPKMGLETAFEALADTGLEEAVLVFADPGFEETAEAIPHELYSTLDGMHRYAHEELAEARQQAVSDCPDLSEVFDEMESLSPEERMPRLRQSLPQAWLECECQGDIEFIAAQLMWPSEQGVAATTHRATIADILDQLASHDHITWADLW